MAYQIIDIFDDGAQYDKSRLLTNSSRITAIKNPYIGNKRKILYHIYDQIQKNNIKYDTVLDPFSGSAACSMIFKSMGKTVHACDILKSSYNFAAAFVQNNTTILSQDEKTKIIKDVKVDGYIYNKYPQFYQKNQADVLQGIRNNIINKWGSLSDQQSINKYSIAMANLQLYIMQRSVVGRLSNGQVISKTSFRKKHHMNSGRQISGKNIYYYNFNDPSFNSLSKAYNQDAFSFLDKKIQAQLIYIDPPYGGSQSDYTAMYNFFEDIVNKTNTYNQNTENKKFARKRQYEENFIQLLKKSSYVKNWAISYNQSSWADIEKLKKCIGKFKKNIKVVQIQYAYKQRKNRDGIQYLILAK